MADALKVLVFKYAPDVVRQEYRNIGVAVAGAGKIGARFLGEDNRGVMQPVHLPRSLFRDRELYLSWYRYWRALLTTSHSADIAVTIAEIEQQASGAYTVSNGGMVFHEVDEDIDAVTARVYERLVERPRESQPEVSESGVSTTGRSHRLAIEIRRQLRAHNVLAPSKLERKKNEELFIPHPVIEKPPIPGTISEPHHPTFYQENSVRYVMEHVDFAAQNASAARDHAAYAAFMLDDIRSAERNLESLELIAVVNRSPRSSSPEQRYGLAALSGVGQIRIIHWDDPDQRSAFIRDRMRIAFGLPSDAR